VEDALSGVLPDVEDEAVAFVQLLVGRYPELLGELTRHVKHVAHEALVSGLERLDARYVLFGYYKNVDGCYGVYVFKGVNELVFVNFLRGQLAPYYLTEDAVFLLHNTIIL